MTSLEAKLGMFLTKEDLNRIEFKGGDENLRIDLHQMKVKDAKRLINNIIAASRGPFKMDVVHGYNKGVALKKMIFEQFTNNRVLSKRTVPNNMGETEIEVSAA